MHAAPTNDDTEALLRLHLAGGRAAMRRGLLDSHGTSIGALAAGASSWRAHGLDETQIRALQVPDQASLGRCRDWLAEPDHHLLGWQDPDYPPLLRRIASPPLALFVAGDPALLWHPTVAVVGSRNATAGGRDNARDFAHAFAGSGLCVASGLAAGIDTAAHEGALAAGGLTVAVLGTGPDVAFPRSNAGLLARIASRGTVVSEHPPGTGPRREHFPSRNRILAGLSLGTVVIEAAERSGALITARQATEAGREVFAVPGSIHNPLARGCHRLLRDGAGLVESATEVVASLAPRAAELARDLRMHLNAPIQPVPGDPTGAEDGSHPRDPDHQLLWNALGHDPTAMDQLVERTGLTAAAVSSMLLVMELDGRVFSQHGRYFRSR